MMVDGGGDDVAVAAVVSERAAETNSKMEVCFLFWRTFEIRMRASFCVDLGSGIPVLESR